MLPGKRYTPEDVQYALLRRKWLILVPWVVVACGVFVYSRSLPDMYRSESIIQVIPSRVPEGYVRSAVATRLDTRLPVIQQQILSRTRLERIIQDFDLYTAERRTRLMEDIVVTMRDRDIKVALIKGDAFMVSFQSRNPRTAMKVTERLASLFIEENLRDREGIAENANQFLESQSDESRRRLLDQEKKLEEYRKEHNGELPSQMAANLQVIQQAQSQIQSLADSINRDRDQRLLIERMIADLSAVADQSGAAAIAAAPQKATEAAPAPNSAAAQLEQARAQLAGMQLRLKPGHPDVVRAQKTIKELEKRAEEEALQAPVSVADPQQAAAGTSPAEILRVSKLAELKAQMENLDRQMARKEEAQRQLQKMSADYQRRVDAVPTREAEMIALTRDYDTLRGIYTGLVTKGEEAKVAANLERRQIGEQFKVIDPARMPEQPFSPNRVQLNGIGVVAGPVLGLVLIGFLEYRDTTFRTDAEIVSVLSLPVIANIPPIVTAADKRQVRRRRRLVALCSSVALALLAVAGVVAWKFQFLNWLR